MDQSLRCHDFTEYIQNTTQLIFITKEEFYNDLNKYLRKLIISVREVTTEFIQDIFIEMCEDHIKQIGRLWFNDLLFYADMYINIDRAIYHRNTAQYKQLYKDAVNNALTKFSSKIIFPSLYGGRAGVTLDELKEEFKDMMNQLDLWFKVAATI